MNPQPPVIRPYQLLCAICALEEGDAVPGIAAVRHLWAALREDPDQPIAICCNVGGVYAYQDPGTADDTPEGADYNRKRDLDILQRMNWPPGIVLPARAALLCVHRQITSSKGLCGYGAPTSDAWKGCPRADSGLFEKAHARGIATFIPRRSDEEMAAEKAESLKAMRAAGEVRTRPHLLLCAVCQYAGGTRPPFKPDNLPEFLQMVLTEKPDIPVRLVPHADWMMCAPCGKRVAGRNACVNVLGSGGMSNEKRDLDVLQKLGLRFGDALPARELYRRIFSAIPASQAVCARPGNGCPSVWWDSNCGEPEPAARHTLYEKGRAELSARLEGAA